jgi:hypothetical protein
VAPAPLPPYAAERAFGTALLAGAVVAAGWVLTARAMSAGAFGMPRWTSSGAALFLPLGALASALGARAAAGRRAPAVQWAAVTGTVAALVLGEMLNYRHALMQRLIAMHAEEGVTDAVLRAQDEHRDMDWWKYLGIEAGFAWFVAVSASLWLAWRLARAPDAVPALSAARASQPSPASSPPPS